jgi:hypothetical protein
VQVRQKPRPTRQRQVSEPMRALRRPRPHLSRLTHLPPAKV